MPTASNGRKEKSNGLGTFDGVFTPSILTILGVIMYLRFGWVVGNVGLLGTLLIVTVSTAITFLTTLSVSEIATDRVVRVGGAYYMISRSLGIESGGAVGIPLYIAQTLSVALYTVGFAESVARTFPLLDQRMTAIATTIAVAVLAIRSASFAIRAQYFIMAAIVLSLVCFFFGDPVGNAEPYPLQWWPSLEGRAGFWTVFAVFFPAVTGIMSGVNMSGDLANPARSIPRGTIAAVLCGFAIYMTLPIFLSQRALPEALVSDPLIMTQMSIWGPAILIGVWGATLSSAIGSILGAPRVLQALALDGILPRWLSFLGKGSAVNNEPRIGTVLTMGIALVAVALGDLDAIAPILTMFFLTTYLVLNVAAGTESFLRSPSFRPAFKVHWSFSFLGALGCLCVMFLINSLATLIAAAIVVLIFFWLERQQLQSTWGDVRQGIWMAMVRGGILRFGRSQDYRNWRPHILVLSGAPTKRWTLVELAAVLTHNRGFLTVSSVLPSGSRDAASQTSLENTVREYLDKRGVEGMVRIVTASDIFEGAEKLVEAYGLGSLYPDTIILGASERQGLRPKYCRLIEHIHQANRNVMILREANGGRESHNKYIDVWWGGLQANGGLMLILSYLVHTSLEWRQSVIRLKLVVPTETAAESARTNLKDLLDDLRVAAEPHVIVADGRSFRDILHASSADADLIYMGLARPSDDFEAYYEKLQDLTSGLPTSVFVLASPDFRYREILDIGS